MQAVYKSQNFLMEKKISGLEWDQLTNPLISPRAHDAAFLCDYIIITSYPVGAGFMCRYPSSSSPELSSELMSPPTRTSTYSSWSSRLLPRERVSSGISPSTCTGPRDRGRGRERGEREREGERERGWGRERKRGKERGVCVFMRWKRVHVHVHACEYVMTLCM